MGEIAILILGQSRFTQQGAIIVDVVGVRDSFSFENIFDVELLKHGADSLAPYYPFPFGRRTLGLSVSWKLISLREIINWSV